MFDPLDQSRNRTAFGLVDLDDVREHRGRFAALGLALVVLGVLAILAPLVAAAATTFLLGWLLVLGGLAEGAHAVIDRRFGGSGWAVVSALLCFVAGGLVLAFPVSGKRLVILVLAGFLVAEGVVKTLRAFQHRGQVVWGWLLFDGLFSLAPGAMLWLHWPSSAAWALGMLVGLELVSSGASMAVIGLGAGRAARTRLSSR